VSERYRQLRHRLERVAKIRTRAHELGPDSELGADLAALAADEEVRALSEFDCNYLTAL
jgi:hypothetical protein